MNNYPEYAEVNNHKYKINIDFRYALKCNQIAQDGNIGDYERALAIIYTLFGDKGLENQDDWEGLLQVAQKYLTCGKDLDVDGEQDMDYMQDMDYIEASFMSDYNIDLAKTNMHWYKFFNLINGLSNSEFGDCCILNRVRNIRTYDLKNIKNPKEKEKIRKAKNQVALKKKTGKKDFTDEEIKNMDEFDELLKNS